MMRDLVLVYDVVCIILTIEFNEPTDLLASASPPSKTKENKLIFPDNFDDIAFYYNHILANLNINTKLIEYATFD